MKLGEFLYIKVYLVVMIWIRPHPSLWLSWNIPMVTKEIMFVLFLFLCLFVLLLMFWVDNDVDALRKIGN